MKIDTPIGQRGSYKNNWVIQRTFNNGKLILITILKSLDYT